MARPLIEPHPLITAIKTRLADNPGLLDGKTSEEAAELLGAVSILNTGRVLHRLIRFVRVWRWDV